MFTIDLNVINTQESFEKIVKTLFEYFDRLTFETGEFGALQMHKMFSINQPIDTTIKIVDTFSPMDMEKRQWIKYVVPDTDKEIVVEINESLDDAEEKLFSGNKCILILMKGENKSL